MVLEKKTKNFKFFLVLSLVIIIILALLICGISSFFVLQNWLVLSLVLALFLAVTYWFFVRFNNLVYIPGIVLVYLVWFFLSRFI
jgi:hypothetical protein